MRPSCSGPEERYVRGLYFDLASEGQALVGEGAPFLMPPGAVGFGGCCHRLGPGFPGAAPRECEPDGTGVPRLASGGDGAGP